MGGRGAGAGFATRIPGADKAYIPDKKVVNFLLDPEKKHYQEFVAVGYSKEDPAKLKNDLLEGLKHNEAKIYATNEHGNTPIEVDMTLGVTVKKKFRTAWQIDKGTDSPRFITAHRIGGKQK